MSLSFNYMTLKVSPEAKEQAKAIINELNLIHNNGELAFWMNIPVPSDYVAIAIYVQDLMDTNDFNNIKTTMEEIKQQLPVGFCL